VPEPASLRLFVALYPTPEAAQAMVAALRGLTLPAHRVVPADQVHLTLHFIGAVAAEELELYVEGVGSAVEGIGRFDLSPRALIGLPPRRPARLVAAETDLPSALHELHGRVAARIPAERAEGGRFLPHMTLCRFREPARVELGVELRVAPFAVREVALMRSTLRAAGAVHERVRAFALGGGP
jgi:2'-5' RNA ligase